MISDSKPLPAPVSPAMKKPTRKAPPPPTTAATPATIAATSVNANRNDTPPISPVNTNDQKARKSPLPMKKPLITSPKPTILKKSTSVDEIRHPSENQSHLSDNAKIPPRPPVRDSSLVNELESNLRRHSSCNENEASKTAKPVPKKRTMSVRT